MTPRILIDTAPVPGGAPLRLYSHGRDHIIMLDRNELMNTRMSGSEEALATMTIDRLSTATPHLLIGGYGMGFTLRAALVALGASARVTVAELVPQILDWARGPMAALTDGCLDDPRVDTRIVDVADAIRERRYDAILLDVDNGPDGVVRPANDRLYSAAGLDRARNALTPGGIMAVWSAGDDPAFTRRLTDAGFLVDEVTVRARSSGKGPRHHIWFAKRR